MNPNERNRNVNAAIIKPFIFDVTCPYCEHEAINPRENSLAWEEGDIEAGAELFCAGCGGTFVLPEPPGDELLAICEVINSKIDQDFLDYCGPYAIYNIPLTVQEIEALRAAIAKAKGEE